MTDDWREKLIETMALQMERRQHGMRFEVASDNMLACARAALDVAEPVIQEQADAALREEIGRLTMALADAEARAERDYLRFVDADREEIKRLLEEAAVWEHDNGVMWRLLSLVTAEKENLRDRIRLLTDDMPAGDARRQLAEQHAEIERLRRLTAG